jgi:hypothetical protein
MVRHRSQGTNTGGHVRIERKSSMSRSRIAMSSGKRSVLKVPDGDRTSIVVSTICTVHNLFGKIYLFFIVLFHRYGVKTLLRNAVAAGRL